MKIFMNYLAYLIIFLKEVLFKNIDFSIFFIFIFIFIRVREPDSNNDQADDPKGNKLGRKRLPNSLLLNLQFFVRIVATYVFFLFCSIHLWEVILRAINSLYLFCINLSFNVLYVCHKYLCSIFYIIYCCMT